MRGPFLRYGSGVLLALLLGFSISTPVWAGLTGEAVIATYEGIINPVAAEYLHDAIASAQETDAHVLIIKLDTPGGLDTSMRLIVKDITNAAIPVVVFVAPSGGRAASAGVFITMGGGEMDTTMKEKVENDSAAYIKSIAEQRGRNVSWAEDAVRKSVSVTEQEALKLKIVDLVADDLPDLLTQLHGRRVALPGGPLTMATAGVEIRPFPMGLRLELLKALSDPNIAYLLMTIGTIGMLAELYNPGAILPGIVGAISLILAFYSLQSLPVNYAGVLLFILGVVFFVLEATVTSYGLLAIGGVVSLTLGSLMLIKSDAEFFQVSWTVIVPVIITTAAVSLFIVGMGVRALRRSPQTGAESMVGAVGVAKTALCPDGKLAIHGELWDAVSDTPVQPGGSAKVLRIEGLTLYVTPIFQKKEA
jgi:membrane-bound serine protease (ClpP class)